MRGIAFCAPALVLILGLCCAVAHGQEGVLLETGVPGAAGKDGEAKPPAKEAPAPEEKAGLAERAQAKLTKFSKHVDKAFAAVAERRLLGLVLIPVSLVAGGVLLLFGWRLLNGLFVPFATVMGALLGGFLAFQVVLALSAEPGTSTLVGVSIVGVVAGVALFCGTALKAVPVAWMLIVAAPFLVVSTFLFPLGRTGQLVAVITVVVGMVLGFASMMKRQPMVIFSTALLGSISLVFCFGIVTHLTEAEALQSVLDFVYKYPFALLGAIGLLTLVGGDLQFITAPSEELEAELEQLSDQRR